MKQELASDPSQRPVLQAELDHLGDLTMAASNDFNDELTLILNHAITSLDLIGADHPAAADLVELQDSVFRCAEITRCLMLLTIRARDSIH